MAIPKSDLDEAVRRALRQRAEQYIDKKLTRCYQTGREIHVAQIELQQELGEYVLHADMQALATSYTMVGWTVKLYPAKNDMFKLIFK